MSIIDVRTGGTGCAGYSLNVVDGALKFKYKSSKLVF